MLLISMFFDETLSAIHSRECKHAHRYQGLHLGYHCRWACSLDFPTLLPRGRVLKMRMREELDMRSVKLDLHGTTFAYNCRKQLVDAILTTRIASCKLAVQPAYNFRVQHEKPCTTLNFGSKLHAISDVFATWNTKTRGERGRRTNVVTTWRM